MNQRPIQRGIDRRRGFSLVEMMVVIALSAMVLGVVVSMMTGLRRWDRRFRARAVECDRLIALGDVIRADILTASDVGTPVNGQLVITSPAGESTRYELGRRGCTRTVEASEAVNRRTELFAIGPATAWNVSRDAAGRRPLVMVTLDRTEVDPQAPRRVPLLVYGALGADHAAAPANE